MVVTDARAAIDVLIPAYNAAETIEGAVQSICRQTFRDIRILVVDDGSTDATPAILQRMAANDSRIQIVTTPNGGIVDALNTGLAAARADFIARFDADDLAFPQRLQTQMDYLATHPECVAVGCHVFHIDAQGIRTGYISQFNETMIGDPFHAPALEPYLLHPFLLVRRKALVDAGGYRYVFHSEDADLYWRLAAFGRLANVTQTLGEYRIHSDSVSARSVLNGRISAVNSQLAALSERRRRNRLPDIQFPRSALKKYHQVESLRGILDIASQGLSPRETGYLEAATAAKLLELSVYRPYRLARDDLRTIRRVVEANYAVLSPVNRRQFVFKNLLMPKGHRKSKEVFHLIPWRIMPIALWEVMQFLTSKLLRRQLEPLNH